MRTFAIASFLVLAAFFAGAQEIPQEQVPPVVVQALQAKYPAVKDVSWEAKSDTYKASFKVESRGHDVWIDKKGQVKKHKQDFPKSQLPVAIRERIDKDFKDYRIDDVDKIEADGQILYQVDLEGAAGKKKLVFTEAGEVKK